jgi:hypothetical protein
MPYLNRLVLIALIALVAGVSTGNAQQAGIEPPADDETLIYVIREGRYAGSMNKMWVAVNDQTVGKIENDAYAVVRAKAGRITLNLATAGIVAGAVAVDDRPGETVYLKWRLGDIHMTEVPTDEAQPLLASLTPTPPIDEILPNNEQVQANFALDILGMNLTQPETAAVEPDDEHAVVTVFRRDKKDRLKVALWSADGYIAALEVNEGVRVKVPAGETFLFAGLIGDAFVKANVEAGKNYYVSIDIGVVKYKVEPVRSKDKRKLDKWLKKVTFVAALDDESRTDRVREREQIVTEFLNSAAESQMAAGNQLKLIGAEHAF